MEPNCCGNAIFAPLGAGFRPSRTGCATGDESGGWLSTRWSSSNTSHGSAVVSAGSLTSTVIKVLDRQWNGSRQVQGSRPVVEHRTDGGGHHPRPEPGRLAVSLVQRERRHRNVRSGAPRAQPLGEERRHPELGGRGRQRQPWPGSGPESLQEPGAAHQIGPQPRKQSLVATNGHPVEVSPLFALDAEELAAKLPHGLEIAGPTLLR